MIASILAAVGVRGILMAGAVAAVAFLAWDYKSTKTALEQTRLELATKEAELEQAEIARDVAVEFGDEQAARADTVRTRTVTIRKRPDGNEVAADILLDTINSLRNGEGGNQASTD